MSLAYVDLTGAEGRQILYRSERHKAKDLLGPTPPKVVLDSRAYALADLSMSGLAILAAANDTLPEVGSAVEIALGDDRSVLFRGKGEVVRIEEARRNRKLGIRLLDSHLDLAEIVAQHRHLSLLRELDEAPYRHQRFVSPDYRKLCADVAFMLNRYRRLLGNAETAAAQGGKAARQRFEELFARCETQFVAEWRELWREGHAAVLPLLEDRRAVAAAKRLTEEVVTPLLMAGPIWKRSYEKPLGYPGDFQIMKYVYDGADLGDSAYGRLCHRIGVEVGMCVRTRMQMMAEHLGTLLGQGQAPARITSLGCGPAAELGLALQTLETSRPAAFTLIDQDDAALSCAYANVFPLLNSSRHRVESDFLQLSFGQLFGGAASFRELPPQDLIYCVGLMDYLPDRYAQMLIGGLYQRLAPGGTLVVGNMKAGTDNIWPMTFVLDWELIYRSEAQMYQLARPVQPADMSLVLDPTGYNYLLRVTAPA